MLSISGCGLVTNELLDHFERQQRDIRELRKNDSKLTKLKTLILLTYYDSDETPIQTCEEDLLLKILMGKITKYIMYFYIDEVIHNELKREIISNFQCVFWWLHDYYLKDYKSMFSSLHVSFGDSPLEFFFKQCFIPCRNALFLRFSSL